MREGGRLEQQIGRRKKQDLYFRTVSSRSRLLKMVSHPGRSPETIQGAKMLDVMSVVSRSNLSLVKGWRSEDFPLQSFEAVAWAAFSTLGEDLAALEEEEEEEMLCFVIFALEELDFRFATPFL